MIGYASLSEEQMEAEGLLTVRILLAVGLSDQAKRIIDQLADRNDLQYRRLEMEVAFKRKDIKTFISMARISDPQIRIVHKADRLVLARCTT